MTYSGVHRDIEEIEFENLGRLLIREGPFEIVFIALDGRRELFPGHPLLIESGTLHSARSETGDRVLLGRTNGQSLYLFDAHTLHFRSVLLRERFPGVAQLELCCSADLFLARTENGLLALDGDGRERWCVERVTYDWRFVARSSGSLFFADSGGNLLGFDPVTGQENF